MANPLLGEYNIKLNKLDYTLKLTMNVIAAYESESGRDFMADAYTAINAAVKAAEHKDNPSLYGQIMCNAVSRHRAALLVYLAAKENNSQVDFGEIQEAFIVDHALSDERFHPAIFTQLAVFAINGKEVKKKETSKAGT